MKKKNKQEAQRLPYSLSTLQIEAGKRYGYSPQEVLDAMQSLYEKKLTTYPRSDCEYLPENQYEEAAEILEHLKNLPVPEIAALVKKAAPTIRSNAWNDEKISAHHAIIPTRIKADFETLPESEQKLYVMMARAYLAQFYPIHEYKSTTVVISFADEEFVGKGKRVIGQGWKAVYQNVRQDEPAEEESALPALKKGESVKYVSSEVLEKTTKPPVRFTSATLLQAIKEIYKYVRNDELKVELKECAGIGTEATRAGIIEKLQAIGFLKLTGKYFEPTEKARTAMKILPEEMIYPDTTAVWEKLLEEVASGSRKFEEFYAVQLKSLSGLLVKAKAVGMTTSANAVHCPSCGKSMIRRHGKNGYFWGCSAYPECKTTAQDINGKPAFGEAEPKTAKCPKCRGEMARYKSRYADEFYWRCKNRDCALILSDHNGEPVAVRCPKCQEGYLVKRAGKKGHFWSCNKYPQCDETQNDIGGLPN